MKKFTIKASKDAVVNTYVVSVMYETDEPKKGLPSANEEIFFTDAKSESEAIKNIKEQWEGPIDSIKVVDVNPKEGEYDEIPFEASSKVNASEYVKADFRSEHLAKIQRAREKKAAARRERAQDIVNKINESEDKMEEAFNLLVPSSGKADTVAGEMVRAMMRILYRDYNDGDVFYEGYGIETCSDAVAYLCDKMPELEDMFENIARRQLSNNRYTDAIKEIADKVISKILANPELTTTKNTEDMFDFNGEEFIEDHEWEPRYELDVTIPDNVMRHIDNGNISDRDLEWELESWDWHYHCQDATVSVQGDSIYFDNLDKETYEELENDCYNWLEQWGNDLDEEYGSEDEE